jgi:uncharacterized protein YcbK (DUF882 family)
MKKVLRRQFLGFGTLALTAGVLPHWARAANDKTERRLAFHSTHTGENIDVVYRIGNDYVPESLAQIDRVLRDHRNNEIYPMRIELLDLLHSLSATLDVGSAFHVISGYRSAATNAVLAAQSEGVAKHSLHIEGKAIDIRLPGCELTELRRAAVALKLGGVGHYPRLDFVHVDIGRVRYW